MHQVRYNRKTHLKVKGGKVQKKNNHQLTALRGFVVNRESPKRGFRHVITKQQLFDFIELIPDWQNLMHGIEAIWLTKGDDDSDGAYIHFTRDGTSAIQISAWDSELVQEMRTAYFDAHLSIFQKIELKFERRKDHVICWFDEAKARAFLLVHIFVHELGHHLDRMKVGRTSSGEPYAEEFANRLEDEIWPKYVSRFGQP